jgi:hypothetical protein
MNNCKSNNFIIYIILFFIFNGCRKIDNDKIIGRYGIDKYEIRDDTNKTTDYALLILNPKNCFELSRYNNNETIKGKWWVFKSKSSTEAVIRFKYSNNQIDGLLNGNILSFEYPNDFHLGKYQNVLYVKLIE